MHRSLVESGDDLFNEAKREIVVQRIFSVQEEAIALKKLIAIDLEAWIRTQGADVKQAAEQGEAASRKLSGL